MDRSQYNGIWVYIEQDRGTINPGSLQLIAKATEIKEKTGEEITALLLGNDVKGLADQLFAKGADRVIFDNIEGTEDYNPKTYAEVAKEIIDKHKPSIVLFAATPEGKDLAPRIQCELRTGLTSDCLDLDIDEDGNLVQIKPSYGGNIMCTIVIPNHMPQMATVRPNVFQELEADTSRTGEVIEEEVTATVDERYELLEVTPRVSDNKPIDQAKIIVAIGDGIKENEIPMFEELAKLIDGEVGVTRPLVDKNWAPYEKQIGQSGFTTEPEFILNIALSGSVQYIAGMDNAETSVTINRDPAAPIYDVTNYGLVAEYEELIPALIAEIKARKN